MSQWVLKNLTLCSPVKRRPSTDAGTGAGPSWGRGSSCVVSRPDYAARGFAHVPGRTVTVKRTNVSAPRGRRPLGTEAAWYPTSPAISLSGATSPENVLALGVVPPLPPLFTRETDSPSSCSLRGQQRCFISGLSSQADSACTNCEKQSDPTERPGADRVSSSAAGDMGRRKLAGKKAPLPSSDHRMPGPSLAVGAPELSSQYQAADTEEDMQRNAKEAERLEHLRKQISFWEDEFVSLTPESRRLMYFAHKGSPYLRQFVSRKKQGARPAAEEASVSPSRCSEDETTKPLFQRNNGKEGRCRGGGSDLRQDWRADGTPEEGIATEKTVGGAEGNSLPVPSEALPVSQPFSSRAIGHGRRLSDCETTAKNRLKGSEDAGAHTLEGRGMRAEQGVCREHAEGPEGASSSERVARVDGHSGEETREKHLPSPWTEACGRVAARAPLSGTGQDGAGEEPARICVVLMNLGSPSRPTYTRVWHYLNRGFLLDFPFYVSRVRVFSSHLSCPLTATIAADSVGSSVPPQGWVNTVSSAGVSVSLYMQRHSGRRCGLFRQTYRNIAC